MEKNYNPSHPKASFPYSISRSLEGASYFGVRAVLLIYLIEKLQLDSVEVNNILGWLSFLLIFAHIVGAVLGDLLIGNRFAIISGAVLQSIGIFLFCIPTLNSAYIGLALIILGGGLFKPNIIASFGETYLDRPNLLDSGFTWHYLILNLGTFLGVLLLGYLAQVVSFRLSFILCGTLMLLSVLPILQVRQEVELKTIVHKNTIRQRVSIILMGVILYTLFWAFLSIARIGHFDITFKLSESEFWAGTRSIFFGLEPYLYFIIAFGAAILWTYFYSAQFFKLALGFILSALGFAIIILIPAETSQNSIPIYLLGLIFIVIGQVYREPVLYSLVIQYATPKYFATVISIVALPEVLLASFYLFEQFKEGLKTSAPYLALSIGAVSMGILGIGTVIYLLIIRKARV